MIFDLLINDFGIFCIIVFTTKYYTDENNKNGYKCHFAKKLAIFN